MPSFPSFLLALLILLAILGQSPAIRCHVCGEKASNAYFEEEEHVAGEGGIRTRQRFLQLKQGKGNAFQQFQAALKLECSETNEGLGFDCSRLGPEFTTCVSVKTSKGEVGKTCNTDDFLLVPGCFDNLCSCNTEDLCTDKGDFRNFNATLAGGGEGGGIKCHVCGRKAAVEFIEQKQKVKARAGAEEDKWKKYDEAADGKCGGFFNKLGLKVDCSQLSNSFKTCGKRKTKKGHVWRGCLPEVEVGCKTFDGGLEQCVCKGDFCNSARGRFAVGVFALPFILVGLSLFIKSQAFL